MIVVRVTVMGLGLRFAVRCHSVSTLQKCDGTAL